ncbi:ADP-ribose pyrophosphatase YjhB (NUDIX family) [Algoriphagus ratkowskyi]|uniref:ADP-ribose pyrophosphatase YjhB (NUDIX family) n=1 Tax=Algoriphagus ratkowskyi TaxID=57028 RepID=A0A2W7REU6_9BACT|nr:NUDIX domain-containing protein [Algoriphagus ratkowskyi]PZX52749.1 ADP-ribose pyrophosphatase YjhB (NUDIX family) [Algoriphagus ratkowskyi]TXD76303.1 NUDIX hydrolase [Algoriphagus ratkowskyi]
MPLAKEEYLPNISYDSVIFGFSGEKLKILILEYHNMKTFALPGGFVKIDEPLDTAVKRGLSERTGLDELYLEQFRTFGSMERFSSEVMRKILEEQGHVVEDHWLLGRFITVAYYALINYEIVVPTPDKLSDSIKWYDFDQLPSLMMDHNEIVEKALDHLRMNLDQKLLSFNLLPERFTMKELKQVYDTILGETQNRANFQRKMLGLNILERHEKLFTGGSHKAPFLYSFKKAE